MDYQFEIIEKTPLYQGFFQMLRYRIRHQLFAGGWSEPFDRECLERGHAVAVLPYDPVRDQVVMVEQFRVGALDTQQNPWLWEIVAGIIEPGESREDVAHREALEEAGCRINELRYILDFLVSPGGTTETIGLYCGLVDSSGLGGIHGLEHEYEDIRVKVMTRTEALALFDAGKITNATAIIALQWLALHYRELQ